MSEDCARISLKIRALTAYGKPRAQVFGAQSHRWLLEPRLHHAEVAEIETRVGIQLPADYRAFLTHVSAGGMGPAYGLRAVRPAVKASAYLAEPFPWTEYSILTMASVMTNATGNVKLRARLHYVMKVAAIFICS